MKKLNVSNTKIVSEVSEFESILLCARLACHGVEKSLLEKACEVFTLKTSETEDSQIPVLMASNPNSGDHKIQTVTLLAAALWLSQIRPDARMKLNTQLLDFMPERMKSEKSELGELLNCDEGTVQISTACRLFLNQAGFPIEVSEQDLNLSRIHLQKLREFLMSQTQRSTAMGA